MATESLLKAVFFLLSLSLWRPTGGRVKDFRRRKNKRPQRVLVKEPLSRTKFKKKEKRFMPEFFKQVSATFSFFSQNRKCYWCRGGACASKISTTCWVYFTYLKKVLGETRGSGR